MTIAERLRKEGMEEGILKGREEGILKGREEGREEALARTTIKLLTKKIKIIPGDIKEKY